MGADSVWVPEFWGYDALIPLGALASVTERIKLGTEGPQSVVTDGTRMFVSSYANNRVLIWNQIPDSALTPPDVVLGQPDFQTITPNTGGISASSFRSAGGEQLQRGGAASDREGPYFDPGDVIGDLVGCCFGNQDRVTEFFCHRFEARGKGGKVLGHI